MFEYSADDPHEANVVDSPNGGRTTFADLFSGIGGFHIALNALGAKCVYAVENNALARKTYEHNFLKLEPSLFEKGLFHEDITQINVQSVPNFDVLCAGFPCQPFSISGNRQGFRDARGNLFQYICQVIDNKRPRAYILENVPNLIQHNHGRTIERIRNLLQDELGYSYHIGVLRADQFNLPQYRPRTFIVGFRDKTTPFRFPAPIELTKTMSDVFGGNCERQIGFTLRVGGRRSPINDKRNWDGYMVDGAERRLTHREAMSMMGFPDWFEFPVSDWSALKQLGNSVAVPVAKAVAKQVLSVLRTGRKLQYEDQTVQLSAVREPYSAPAV